MIFFNFFPEQTCSNEDVCLVDFFLTNASLVIVSFRLKLNNCSYNYVYNNFSDLNIKTIFFKYEILF